MLPGMRILAAIHLASVIVSRKGNYVAMFANQTGFSIPIESLLVLFNARVGLSKRDMP